MRAAGNTTPIHPDPPTPTLHMTHQSPATRTARRRFAPFFAAVAATAATFVSAAPASAAPVTYTDASGASVTLSDDQFAPGETITVTGKNFKGYTTSPTPSGDPIVFVKLNDQDVNPPLEYGGSDALLPGSAFIPSDEVGPAFVADQTVDNGGFTGWIKVPATTPLVGPENGRHWLRFLSGAAFTTTGNRLTVPTTFQAYFNVVSAATIGYQQNPSAAFTAGNVVPAGGGTLTVKGRTFSAGEQVTVKFDGGSASNVAVVGSDGTFSGNAVVPPSTEGDHTLTFESASKTVSQTVRVVAHSATLLTPNLRPGGLGLARVQGFVGINGTGQRVAIITGGGPNTVIYGCGNAAADGSALIQFKVPDNQAAGNLTFSAVAGAVPLQTCPTTIAAPIVVSPMPRPATAMAQATIAADAVTAGTTFTHGSVGVAFPVTGSGFGAGESVAVKVDATGAAIGTLNANAEGAITGNVTLPASTPLGAHVLTFESATKTAADTITAIAAPTYEITTPAADIKPGAKLTFSLTGFRRGFAREDNATGQKVGVRLDDTGAILTCVQTDDNGNGTGSVDLPASHTPGTHRIRFLAGSACVNGQSNDLPSRSLFIDFNVNELPKVDDGNGGGGNTGGGNTNGSGNTNVGGTTPPPTTPAVDVQKPIKVSTVDKKKFTFSLTLDAGTPTKLAVSVKTAKKVKLTTKSKAKIVTLVKATTVRPKAGAERTVKLTLTADGKALLKRLKKTSIVVTVDPDGSGATTSGEFTLRLKS